LDSVDNRSDAARGKILRRDDVRVALWFNYEFEAAWSSGASSRMVDTVEGVLVRGYVIASPRCCKCGPGKQVFFGDVVERRRGRSFWWWGNPSLDESAVVTPTA